MKEVIKYEITPDGFYIGQSVSLPAVITQATSFEELKENSKDAMKALLTYYLEQLDNLEFQEVESNVTREFIPICKRKVN